MRVIIMVQNSLIKDPRVQRSTSLAHEYGDEVCFVGLKDQYYTPERMAQFPFDTWLVEVDPKYYREGLSLAKKLWRELYVVLSLARQCRALRADVIHANDFDTVPSAWLASLFRKTKVVYDSHEVYTENYEIAQNPLMQRIVRWAESFLIRRVAQVVSVSHAASRQLASMYYIPTPMVVTNCAYRCQVDLDARKHAGFEVLYHGKMTPNRGYEEFVLAAEHIPPGVKLVLRGFGVSEDALRQLVTDHKLEDRVRFAPAVEIAELIPAATESHVGVVLTKPVCLNYEYTVSNKLFEYLSAGIPVILSSVAEHVYLVEKYHFGLLVAEVTPEQVGAAITRLANDPQLYQELRANAIAAAKELCWEVEGKKFVDLYARLAAQR